MLTTSLRPTWCEIDLEAIEQNLGSLLQMVGPRVQVYVCLKGDAFGCGAIEVGRACERSGAHGLTFGNIDTAIACREAGIELPMLLYPTCLPSAAQDVLKHRLAVTISSIDEARRWANAVSQTLDVFIKIDTGGFRAGVFPEDGPTLAKFVAQLPSLRLKGVYGHSLASYLNGGSNNPEVTSRQIRSFANTADAIERAGVAVPIRMCSSSETILSHPDADHDAVDPGRLILGLPFSSAPTRNTHWHPSLRALRSTLILTKCVDRHDGVESTPFFPIHEGMTIGLMPYGWSDGCPKELAPGAYALVRGQRAPFLPPVHSELLRVDLTNIPEASAGDQVTLLGRDGQAEIDLPTLSSFWQRPLLDLYSTIGKGVPRIYVRGNRCTQRERSGFSQEDA